MDMSSYKKEIKITLWGFLIAFVFSIILGLIVGNPIGISFMRAFVSSLLFAIVIFGIIYIVKKYVPEITEVTEELRNSLKGTRNDEKEGNSKGSKVDYVVGGKSNAQVRQNTGKEAGSADVTPPFENVLSNVEKERATTTGKQEEEKILAEDIPLNKEENELSPEDELPPIEELLNEEEDIVPETEIEEEAISGQEKKINSDYIKIGDVKIPNEPEIIAKAIKKVMKENE